MEVYSFRFLSLSAVAFLFLIHHTVSVYGTIGDGADILGAKYQVANYGSTSSASSGSTSSASSGSSATLPSSILPEFMIPVLHRMRKQLETHLTSSSSPISVHSSSSTDCSAYYLMYEYALQLQPSRAPLAEVFDSLQLYTNCNITPPALLLKEEYPSKDIPTETHRVQPLSYTELDQQCGIGPVYVEATVGVTQAHDTKKRARQFVSSPTSRPLQGQTYTSLHTAVESIRTYRSSSSSSSSRSRGCIILSSGIHSLDGRTLALTTDDSSLIITGETNNDNESRNKDTLSSASIAWISGGTALTNLQWSSFNLTNGMNIWRTSIPASFTNISSLLSLNTLSVTALPTRLTLAQYPNFDPEIPSNQWLPPNDVALWHKPNNFSLPEQYFINLTASGLKNDSTMVDYNYYGTGRGGPCGLWRGDPERLYWSYWCSNISAGGWAFVDNYMSTYGILQLPIGMTYNSTKLGNKFTDWTLPPYPYNTVPENMPLITAFMDQTWFTDTFAITSMDASNSFFNLTWDNIYPSGGWQGGRNWHTEDASPHTNLVSGPWYVSNVLAELDYPNEFYFDPVSRTLYYYYNATSGTPPPSSFSLSAPTLDILINITGTSPSEPVQDIVLAGVGIRDQRPSLLDDWTVPSGGDWALRPSGAIKLQNSERINITNSILYRLDGNAIYLYGYNRNATITNNEFGWLGMSAIVFFGTTVQEDATDGYQPWGTVIDSNYVHELGIQEKQSSAVFFGKTPLTRISNNIFFNGPRAMINVNDNTGGGLNITQNAIWNTCRVSGDHGPINSWSRQPFLTLIPNDGTAASYTSAMNDVSHNYIISNYGGSQGFDTDDGSSFNDIHDNFYYQSSGFKMDYGGHDSSFHDNVVISHNNENCLGTAHFVAGHEDTYYNNICVNPVGEKVDDLFENCPGGVGTIRGNNNQYFTPLANATASCSDSKDPVPLAKLGPGVETNFTSSTLPDTATIIQWAKEKLNML